MLLKSFINKATWRFYNVMQYVGHLIVEYHALLAFCLGESTRHPWISLTNDQLCGVTPRVVYMCLLVLLPFHNLRTLLDYNNADPNNVASRYNGIPFWDTTIKGELVFLNHGMYFEMYRVIDWEHLC